MTGEGESWEALAAARDALAARDSDLAAADQVLAGHVREAHRLAVDSVRDLDALRAAVESAVAADRAGTPPGAREMSRQLLAATREAAAVVREARSAAITKAIALQRLMDFYQH